MGTLRCRAMACHRNVAESEIWNPESRIRNLEPGVSIIQIHICIYIYQIFIYTIYYIYIYLVGPENSIDFLFSTIAILGTFLCRRLKEKTCAGFVLFTSFLQHGCPGKTGKTENMLSPAPPRHKRAFFKKLTPPHAVWNPVCSQSQKVLLLTWTDLSSYTTRREPGGRGRTLLLWASRNSEVWKGMRVVPRNVQCEGACLV